MERAGLPIAIAGAVIFASCIHYLWNKWLSFYYTYFPVSYPGDARPNPLARLAAWEPRKVPAIGGWKLVTAAESHAATEKEMGFDIKLTGEPAGRQIWVHDPQIKPLDATYNPAVNAHSADILMRTQMTSAWAAQKQKDKKAAKAKTVRGEGVEESESKKASRAGFAYLESYQCEDGHLPGDYSGPMFLMPGLVIAHHVTGSSLGEHRNKALVHYLRNHQQVDGGWGTHIECASTMFGTVLNYVALRLLGVPPEDPCASKALAFIHRYGGALMTVSWAKFWLAVLGVYEWEGINSVPAELWMLPRILPFHPGRLWCHCRMVYLPMSYLYSRRWTYPKASSDPLISALRKELYLTPYESIDWDGNRHSCNPDDVYAPPRHALRFLQNSLAFYERWLCVGPIRYLRNRGIDFAMKYMHAEDQQTNFIDIGPVNKAFNMVCVFADVGNEDERFKKHLQRVPDYLWVAEDGMKMQGYNGSQLWDTAFMLQAVVEVGLSQDFPALCRRGWNYLDSTQIKTNEDNYDYWYRHVSKGGWPFSTAAHGWPIADCTGDGLKAVLLLKDLDVVHGLNTFEEERVWDAVNILLTLQNVDGGWATYENNRGYGWYESLNPSEVFGDIMIDYSYVELTTAAVGALAKVKKIWPEHPEAPAMRTAILKAKSFLLSIQRPDGSWYGSWAVCFTYGTWFGVKGLLACGENPKTSKGIQKAVEFVLSKQNENGGWGESYLACVNKAYPDGTVSVGAGTGGASEFPGSVNGAGDLGVNRSGVIQTAWAILTLMAADIDPPNMAPSNGVNSHSPGRVSDVKLREAVRKGAEFLISRQRENGDWPQEGITGVFNRSCGIFYSAYRNIFPSWALGMYALKYDA